MRNSSVSRDKALDLTTIGNRLRETGQYHAAIRSHMAALRLAPEIDIIHLNLGACFENKSWWQWAEYAYREALKINPGRPETHINLAILLFKNNRYAEGFRHFPARWKAAGWPRHWPKSIRRRWQGEPLVKKKLLVFSEQRSGDTIQGLRFLPALKTANPDVRLLLRLPVQLLRLAMNSDLADQYIDEDMLQEPPSDYDYAVSLWDIPAVLGWAHTGFGKTPYIKVPESDRIQWGERLSPFRRIRAGLVWEGYPGMPEDRCRNIPLRSFAVLQSMGVDLISIQTTPGGKSSNDWSGIGIRAEWGSRFRDFADTAACISQLDLVIAPDSPAAHLAGALGKPVFLLLHQQGDWRWGTLENNSPWYNTLTLIRQREPGNWEDPVERLCTQLQSFMNSPPVKKKKSFEPHPPQKRIDDLVNRFRSGQAAYVVKACKAMLDTYSRSYILLHLLGTALTEQGQLREALSVYDRAIRANPDHAETHNNMGVVHMRLGDLDSAADHFEKTLRLKPDFPEACNNLGNTLQKKKQLKDALKCYERAIALRPDSAEAHNNRGNALKELGRMREAAEEYEKVLRLMPGFVEALTNLGIVQQELGQTDAALANYETATTLDPNYVKAYNNRGIALKEMGQLDAAVENYEKAIALNPDYFAAHCNRGEALKELGQFHSALESYEKAIELAPDNFKVHSNLLFCLNSAHSADPSEIQEKTGRYERLVAGRIKNRHRNWSCAHRPERLKVGVVSGDLANHPVGFFLENVLKQLNPLTLELIAFPTKIRDDEMAARLKPRFTAWKPIVGLDDDAAADLIHSHGSHILLDLSGHTAHNRLPVFARKPAPVQATWLGYFATTGIKEMDYLISDPVTSPENDTEFFSEKIWRLPDTRLCFTPPDSPIKTAPLPCLRSGHITFGCFNNLNKMNERVISVWAEILAAVRDSRLFLKAKQLKSPATQNMVLRRFQAHGISRDRLILEGSSSRQTYLKAYHRVDLSLDPFPYPGGTTSVEGLWMGVPVLTRKGSTLLSRQGESIVKNAGLPDWIATDDKAYVAKAVSFAADWDRLSGIREALRKKVLNSPLFDSARFSRHFETMLWQMWRNYAVKNGG